MKGFDGEVRARLEGLLADPRLARAAVAFDADGTLWAGDVGEMLLRALIGLGRVPSGSFARYERLLGEDCAEAFAFCVRVMKGMRAREVEAMSEELVRAYIRGQVFAPMCELARAMEERGAEVFVVSASNAWTVCAGARMLGLREDRVLAVTGAARGGVLTGEVTPPVTCGHGKLAALRRATERPLLFAAGNGVFDLEMLEAAEVALAVGPRGEETPLLRVARERGWLAQRLAALPLDPSGA